MIGIHSIVEYKDSKEGWFKKYPIEVSLEYDKYIAAMLANINNEVLKIQTIFDPVIDRVRGIPVDASNEYLSLLKEYKGDNHSYYYLRELKNLEKIGYWDNLVEYNTYRKVGKQLFDLIKELEKIEIEKKICHNCIRLCFYFY